jgi:hypothetical protein
MSSSTGCYWFHIPLTPDFQYPQTNIAKKQLILDLAMSFNRTEPNKVKVK